MEVIFYIGRAEMSMVLNFERVVRSNTNGLRLERLEMLDKEILYRATTDQPKDLLLLGATIFCHNDEIGHYPKNPKEQAAVAGNHPG